MLQEILFVVIGGVIGIIGSIIGFFLQKKWDIEKKEREKEEEFNKIKIFLTMELSHNIARMEANIDVLKRYTSPIVYLIDEAWKVTQYSGLLYLFHEILTELSTIYHNVGMINQHIAQREHSKTTKLADDELRGKCERLSQLMHEILKKVEVISYRKLTLVWSKLNDTSTNNKVEREINRDD